MRLSVNVKDELHHIDFLLLSIIRRSNSQLENEHDFISVVAFNDHSSAKGGQIEDVFPLFPVKLLLFSLSTPQRDPREEMWHYHPVRRGAEQLSSE